MKTKPVNYRKQIYNPLRALSFNTSAIQMVSQRFDRSPDSAVVRHMIEVTMQSLQRHEEKSGIQRISPFHLRLVWAGTEIVVPLLSEALLSRLIDGQPYRLALCECREEVFKEMLSTNRSATMDAVRRLLAPTERLAFRGGKSRVQNLVQSVEEVEQCRADLSALRRLCQVPDELCPPPQALPPPPEPVVAEVGGQLQQEGMSAESARSFVAHLAMLRERFMPPKAELAVGQLVAIAIDVNDRRRSFPASKRAHMPVRLTLYTEQELAVLERLGPRDHERVLELMGQRIARILTEAYCQGGLLSQTVVGLLTHLSAGQVSKFVEAFERRHGVILPTPGTIHDAGAKLTHKVMIINRHLDGDQIGAIARQTFHSEEAVARYVDDFERVLIATAFRLPVSLMPRVTKIARHVVEQYVALIESKVGDSAAVRALIGRRGIAPENTLLEGVG